VHERARVLGLVGLDDVEPVVLELLLERRLELLTARNRERGVLRELLVDVLEDVLPRRLCRERAERDQE